MKLDEIVREIMAHSTHSARVQKFNPETRYNHLEPSDHSRTRKRRNKGIVALLANVSQPLSLCLSAEEPLCV